MARKIKLNVPVEKQPIDIAPFLDIEGSVTQKLQNDNGSYIPDRKSRPMKINPRVRLVDPNTVGSDGKPTWINAEISSVSWHCRESNSTEWSELTAKSGEIGFDDNTKKTQLLYYINVPSEKSGRVIKAEIKFKDPSTLDGDGNMTVRTCNAEITLTTYVSAALALSLVDNPGTDTVGHRYAQDGYVINPLNTPFSSSDATVWQRYLRCQLKDGVENVEMANNGKGDYNSTPQGNAFYFWYQVIGNAEVLLTADTGWFDGTFYEDGTASPECMVDLSKIQNVHLRCRAGYIPYGQLGDYIDANTGKILPSMCDRGYLSIDYRLSLRLPAIQKMEVIPVSKDVCLKSELGRSDVPFIRRLHIVCAGHTINDLSLSVADWRKRTEPTYVEKLFNIKWSYNGEEKDGEFLDTTMAGVGSSVSNPNPEITVEVSPVYPQLWGDNYVMGYKDETTSVTPIEKQGNPEWLRNYNFVLCDMTKTIDRTDNGVAYKTQAYTILQRDNLLRNIDGAYSPAVVISDAQYADSTLALYTKSGSTYSVYCSEGNYDPVAYVENMLRPFYAGTKTAAAIKLYKKASDGTYSEAHALLPWETVDNKWSIFLDSFGRDIYYLDNVTGDSGTVWRGIFSDLSNVEGGKWDGIDISKHRMRRTGISPCPAAVISYGGKPVFRNMFYLKQGWYSANVADCQGGAGTGNCTTMLKDTTRTYPCVTWINALKTDTYSRNNNPSVSAAYPCAEGGFNNMSATVMAQELIHGTKSLYTASMYGSGISSNEPCANEDNFNLSGGTRMKLSSGSTWTHYKKWNEAAPFKPAASTAATNMTTTLNQEYPKEQCMESLIVLSFAKEFGIAADTWFTVYGGTYKYVTPSGCKGLADGYMNARVYKDIGGTVNGYNTSTSAAETWDVEVMLRMSVCGGFNLCGDIFSYWPGGADVIITIINDPNTSKVGNRAEAYYELDQLKWVKDSNTKLALATQFESQKAYNGGSPALEISTYNAWLVKRGSYVPIGINKTQSGGGISAGECCYVNLNNDGYGSDLTVHQRAALRFRYNANNSNCAPRSMSAHNPATTANRSNGGSAQVLL